MNGEIQYACNYADLKSLIGTELPPFWDDVAGHDDPTQGVVIVDHNNPEQMPGDLGSDIGAPKPPRPPQFAPGRPLPQSPRAWPTCSFLISRSRRQSRLNAPGCM